MASGFPAPAVGMAAEDRWAGSKPHDRVKILGENTFQTFEKGQSEGTSAGRFVVGWGSLVRSS